MCRFVKCIMRIIKNRLLQRSLNKADTDSLVSMVKQLALSFVDAECLQNFPYPKNEEETNFLCFAISMMKSVEDQDFLKRISAERKKTIQKTNKICSIVYSQKPSAKDSANICRFSCIFAT